MNGKHDKWNSQAAMKGKIIEQEEAHFVESVSPWQEKKRETIYYVYTCHSLPLSIQCKEENMQNSLKKIAQSLK